MSCAAGYSRQGPAPPIWVQAAASANTASFQGLAVKSCCVSSDLIIKMLPCAESLVDFCAGTSFIALFLPARGGFRSASHSGEDTRLLDEIETGQSSSGRSDVGSSRDRAEAHGYWDVLDEVKNEHDAQLFAAQVFDHENWEIPYIESYSRGGGNQKIDSWLNALLCTQKNIFSHQVGEIPLVKLLLELYQHRSEELLKVQLSVFFQRINTLDLTKRDPIQDASIVDFILVLASITESNQSVNGILDRFPAMIQEYIMLELPQLEQKLSQSGRNDIQSLISNLILWRSKR
ncbi:hypothetical protein VP01_2237g3 [Puccinia sorghi]|uniref:Uncharacterized protein n=1 Tax=Puccinia sorghi TaxID=27349 RepID=A0A0L6V8H8_9BASI|nr:hypothetical protein VP01_2237g3 [Puccinia sorghi]